MNDPPIVAANSAPLTASQRVALSRRRKRKDIVFVGIEVLPTERDDGAGTAAELIFTGNGTSQVP